MTAVLEQHDVVAVLHPYCTDPPKVTDTPLFLYNWICPYVHRVSLALAFKDADIPKVEIDLEHKPTWLPVYSPHKKVPAITYVEGGDQQVLYESLALLYWVDEYFEGGPQLMPRSPAQRALARIIMSRSDHQFVHLFYTALVCQDADEFAVLLPKLREELSWLEEHMDSKGPFLLGAQPTLVDAAVAPWLLRSGLIQHYKNVDMLAQHPRLTAYLEHLKQLPQVQGTFLPPSGSGFDMWTAEMNAACEPMCKERLDFSAVDN